MKIKFLVIFCIFSLFSVAGCKQETTKNSAEDKKVELKSEVYYTCSMHPQIKESKPGKCPICHMNLTKVEVEKDSEEDKLPQKIEKEVWQCKNFPDVQSESADTCPLDGTPMVRVTKMSNAGQIVAKVKLRKAQIKHFFPEVFPVSKMKMTKKIRLLGSVLQSEEKESNIPARVDGRVEKVYVRSTGSMVRDGDPVIDLYSPKLITAGEEYLLARRSYQKNKSKEFKDMLFQSSEKLKLWGIREFQMAKWYRANKVPRKITIYSNATGIVRQRNAIIGKYFKEGQNFFELSDLQDVWVEMDVYELDSSLIKLGQEVKLEFSALPGEVLQGGIDFVNPVLDRKSRTLKVRTTISNKLGKLKPGMIANAEVKIELEGSPFVIPRTAVIDTGKRKVVWIRNSKRKYEARVIQTGFESEGYVEIRKGLKEGAEVVIEGNFLLDAQAQLFGGYEDMTTEKMTAHGH